jgi:protein TonB
MPRDLFGDVTRPSISIGNRKWYTVPVSLLTHSAIVFAVVVVPLLATDVLPRPWQPMGAVIIGLVPPAPPPLPKLRAVDPKPMVNRDAAPIEAPDTITPERPPDFDDRFQDTNPVGFVGGTENIETIIAGPPLTSQTPPKPVQVGGMIRAPLKVSDVAPVYPRLALEARVQGIVIIEATIGVDGRVENARILRGVPLLDQAALDAVRQWQYKPTTLNGVPVPVIMTVTVTFTLSK